MNIICPFTISVSGYGTATVEIKWIPSQQLNTWRSYREEDSLSCFITLFQIFTTYITFFFLICYVGQHLRSHWAVSVVLLCVLSAAIFVFVRVWLSRVALYSLFIAITPTFLIFCYWDNYQREDYWYTHLILFLRQPLYPHPRQSYEELTCAGGTHPLH